MNTLTTTTRFPSSHLASGLLKRATSLLAAACAFVTLASASAHAQSYTFSPFNQTVTSDIGSRELVGAPAGVTYTSYTVSVDWVAGAGVPWSEEAIWAFVSEPSPGSANSVFYADPSSAPNSASNGNPVTLTWEGFMDTPYIGGTPLYFWHLQAYTGSFASWNNITITLGTDTATPPPATVISTPSSTTGLLGAGEVHWFQFDYTGGALEIDTLGSELAANNDTELALYNAFGGVVALNDDIDFAGGNLLSRLSFADGELDAGTYYVALGGWNTIFNGGFSASSTSAFTGSYRLNVNFNSTAAVPEASTSLLMGLGILSLGLVSLRRSSQNSVRNTTTVAGR